MGYQTDYGIAEEARKKDANRIRVVSISGQEGGLSLRGATPQEIESLQGMVAGLCWVSTDDEGRLVKKNKLADVPGPADDEMMMPFWSPAVSGQVQSELSLEMLPDGWYSPGLQIQGLGAGAPYSRDAYAEQAAIAESFGFECLRSRRNKDSGQFWEIWYLPSLYSAKGRLKEILTDHSEMNDKEKLEVALRFLCRNLRFGSLDVKWQVAALVYD